MGILPGHASIVTALDIGNALVRTSNGWTSIAIMGGFALVQNN